ncbi:MAG TPA: GYD domain-containing protein [Acidimicrobiales bacterium]|nr:GYD domain-containing protein [Acidimicrobiales bacterium]
MAKYIILGKFTQQGIQTIKDAPKRRAKAIELASALGGEIKDVYVTMGQYDLVVVLDAPNDEAVAKLILQVGMQGNLSTQTLRAFDEAETDRLVASL